jgi:hypothetical protein
LLRLFSHSGSLERLNGTLMPLLAAVESYNAAFSPPASMFCQKLAARTPFQDWHCKGI